MKKLRSFSLGIGLTLIASFALFSLSSCAKAQKTSAAPKGVSASLVTASDTINDQSFNQGAWEGLQKAQKQLGIDISYKESEKASERVSNIELFADQHRSAVICVGFLCADAIKTAAQHYHNQKFIIVDYSYATPLPNVSSLTFNVGQASFLAGYAAAKTSKTHQIAFIGGIQGAIVDAFKKGFIAGARYADPKIEVKVAYIDSFTDSDKAKNTAENFYRQGVDVIFHAAGGAGDGVIEAAKDTSKWVIGVDRDQSYLAPENVLTSVMKNVNVAVFDAMSQLKKNPSVLPPSKVYGLTDGGVGLAKTTHFSPELQKELTGLQQKLISGDIKA